MLKKGSKIAFTGCSNPLKKYDELNKLVFMLTEYGFNVKVSPLLFRSDASPSDKAEILDRYFEDDDIKAIFDISGGDLANEIIEYIDFDLIKRHGKPFFGYSDLTCVLNAVNEKSDIPVYLYQIRNIIYKNRNIFLKYMYGQSEDLTHFRYSFISGNSMKGITAGGNMRCLLKLAGTKYFPDLHNKLLFLESYSGNENRIRSYFAQLRQTGAFDDISGLILGTFTELEKDCNYRKTCDIASSFIPSDIPVVKTNDIGHSVDSKMLIIGRELSLCKGDGYEL